MVRPREVALSSEQQRELVQLRDHHAKPYVRERAAAILKVAAGHPVRQVAMYALHKPKHPETVSEWINRYLEQGASALLVREGRGRKPAFSPSAPYRPQASPG